MKRLLLSAAAACGLASFAFTPASAVPASPESVGQPAAQVEQATRMGRYRLMRRRIIRDRMMRRRAMRRRSEIKQHDVPFSTGHPTVA